MSDLMSTKLIQTKETITTAHKLIELTNLAKNKPKQNGNIFIIP